MVTCAQQQLLSVVVFAGYFLPMILIYAFVVGVAVVKLERTTFHALLLGIAFGDAFAISAEIGLVVQRFSQMSIKFRVFNVFCSSFGMAVGQKAQFLLALTRLASLLRPVFMARITPKQTVVALVIINSITFLSKIHFFLPGYSIFWLEPGNETYRQSLTREGIAYELCHRAFDTALVIGGAACYIAIALAIRLGNRQSQLRGTEVRILLQGVCVTVGYLFFDINWVADQIMRASNPGLRPACAKPVTWKVIVFYFAVGGNGIVYCFFNRELQQVLRAVIAKPTSCVLSTLTQPTAVSAWTVPRTGWSVRFQRRLGLSEV